MKTSIRCNGRIPHPGERYSSAVISGSRTGVLPTEPFEAIEHQNGFHDLYRMLCMEPDHFTAIIATGDSMKPLIRSGDVLLVDKSASRFSDNPTNMEECLNAEETESVSVTGTVAWISRKG